MADFWHPTGTFAAQEDYVFTLAFSAASLHRFGYSATTRGTGDWLTDGLAKQDYQLGRTELQLLDGRLTSPQRAGLRPP